MILVYAIAAARAQSECGTPFTAYDLRALVERSEQALLDDDVVAHGRLWSEFVQRAPCLDAEAPRDALARLLLDEAIARRVQRKEWMPLLDAAIDAWPPLEYPDYLRSEFSPIPPAPPSDQAIPEDATLFVDGALAPRVPGLAGEHLVQVWRGGKWRSAWVEDGAVPAGWLEPKQEVVVQTGPVRWKPASRGTIGAALGPVVGRQFVAESEGFLGDQQVYGLLIGAVSSGVVPVADNVGVYWDGRFDAFPILGRKAVDGWSLDPARLVPVAFVGPAIVLEDVTVGVGGGVVTALHYEGDAPVLDWLPQPDVSASFRRDRADVALSAGVFVNGMHARLSVGSISDTENPLTLRVGVDGDLVVGFYSEKFPGQRQASALSFVAAFRLDAAWGRDR